MKFETFRQKYAEWIDKELDSVLDDELLREYVKGGKRLRPVALILSYLANNGQDVNTILKNAVGIELYHNFTLIIDDIIDDDKIRRGRDSLHVTLEKIHSGKGTDLAVLYALRLRNKAASMIKEKELP